METYILVIVIISGSFTVAVVVVLCIYLFNKFRFPVKQPPSIILTTDSPVLKVKRLWSPAKVKRNIKLKHEREAAAKRREYRQQIKTFWLPKTVESMPVIETQSTFVQPTYTVNKVGDIVRGRLNCVLHYMFIQETKRSVFTVKLVSCKDLPSKDLDVIDVFVKTTLYPSGKDVFTSKVKRQTLNPDFNEIYKFEISYNELQQQILKFLVLDFDCLNRHKVIGEVTIPLSELGTHGFNILREVNVWMNISKVNT